VIVAVVGSRDFPNIPLVEWFVRRLADKHPGTVVMSGGARGVDKAAEATARACGLAVVSYRPFGPTEYEGEWVWTFPRERLYGIHEYIFDPIDGEKKGEDRWEYGVYRSYRDAAYARNTHVAQMCHRMVGFIAVPWTGGTRHALSEARRFGRERTVYDPWGERVPELEVA
jgi:hypothetical protein